MNQRLSRRTGMAMATSLVAAAAATRVTVAQRATPAASTVSTIPDLPQGPLGEQIQWFVDLINGDPADITAAAVESHFSENALTAMSAPDLATMLADVATQLAPITVEPNTMFTTRNMPPTSARFIVRSASGDRVQVNLGVSSASGHIETLTFSTAPPAVASPIASPEAAILDLPQGPLGEQIQWLVNLLNGDSDSITGDAIEPRMSPLVLAEVSATDLALIIGEIALQVAPVEVEPQSMVTTRDLPPSSAQFVLVGNDSTRLLTTLSVDGESGLITGLYFQPAPRPNEPAATPPS